MKKNKSVVTFTLNPDEYCCRFGTIYIEGKTKYISDGTYIFWAGKTLLVYGTIPQYTERTKPLTVECIPMSFDNNYYDVVYVEADNNIHAYKGVSM